MQKKTALTSALLVGGVLALGAPLAASAHVHATADSSAAGSTSLVTFEVPHGCEGATTNTLTIDIPEGIDSVTPTVKAGWDVEKVADGDRVSQVVYTAQGEGLADGFRDTFALSVPLPAGEEGDVLQFPTTQGCEGDATAVWEGEDAPSVTLTAATEGDGHGHEHGGTATGGTEQAAATATDSPLDVFTRVVGIAGLVVGVIALITAIASRRRPSA
jgi:uncharacterized protein YcnI